MQIPVFVSCPSSLSPAQEAARGVILAELAHHGLEPRALGVSDYSTELPLREVVLIARHCSGGVILGFEQFHATAGLSKRGTDKQAQIQEPRLFPTPWNHLEAGILFGLKLPLLVFREEGVSGGIFDHGVTDTFTHVMPSANLSESNRNALREVFRKWQARVQLHYYSDT